MKKYVVLKQIGGYAATVERQFEDFQTAKSFRDILVESEEKMYIAYYVAEIVE